MVMHPLAMTMSSQKLRDATALTVLRGTAGSMPVEQKHDLTNTKKARNLRLRAFFSFFIGLNR